MSEFNARQIAQMRFSIVDFRNGSISLNALISKLEAAARAISPEFWEQNVFATVFDLETDGHLFPGNSGCGGELDRDSLCGERLRFLLRM